MLRLLMVAVAVCALSAEAQDGCTQSDCTTSSVRVLPGALPTCNYSRRGTIRQDRDGGVYVCGLAFDAGSVWSAVAGPNAPVSYWYDGGSGAIQASADSIVMPNGGMCAVETYSVYGAFKFDNISSGRMDVLNGASCSTAGTTLMRFDGASNFVGVGSSSGATTQFFVGNGSASIPTYSFHGDTDTGFFRYGSNQIGVGVGGVAGLYFGAGYIVGSSANAALTVDGSRSRLTWGTSYVDVTSGGVELNAASGYVSLNGNLRNTGSNKPVMVEDTDGIASVGVAAASLPTCDATHNGSMQLDLTANKWRVCDSGGASWHYLAQQWTFGGWLPALTTTTVVTVAETVAAVDGVVYSLHVKPPVGLTDRTGGNVVYTVYDNTSSTVLCTLTVACSAGSGSTTSCTGAVVAGHTLRLRADQTGCTGGTTNTEGNIVAGVKGGL